MNNSNISSNILVRPSFVEGFSRILDIGTTLQEYNTSNTEEEADLKALRNDWNMVGKDFKISISNYEKQTYAESK